MAQDDVDKITASLLRGEFLGGSDEYEAECDALARRIIEWLKSTDPKTKVTAMRLKDNLKTAVIRMIHGADDPKWVPIRHIRHALSFPAIEQTRMFSRPEQRKTIDGPTRAIRVKCLECQGGGPDATTGVRECAATGCALWAFRMGSNPFFGRMVGSEDEVTETDAEIDAMEALRQPIVVVEG
jgi:hypothetical protein